jgi:DNA-binding transcriptional MerR regulator/methylmalonyl-CoA mutase cobalamin-binding subunit
MNLQINSADAGDAGLGIAALERDTGIGKETLRVWERRYGFPQPLRDAFGERVYPADQVARLRLIKRLMDKGGRPGNLLRQPLEDLNRQLAEVAGAGANPAADWVIPLLKQREAEPLRAELAQRLARDGLERFVIELVPALNARIGDGWMNGEIEVFEEHLYTELMQNQLRSAIHALGNRGTRPRVLLTTIKDEEHVLGLLMAEALLAMHGAGCVSLGAQTPVGDIAGAARATGAEIVALSFSGACPWRKARDSLVELRAALPPRVALWAGGAGLAGHARKLAGVQVISGLAALAPALAEWRAAQAVSQAAGA